MNFFSNSLLKLRQCTSLLEKAQIHYLTSYINVTPSQAGGNWSLIPIRTKIRNYWPRPNERMRIKKHGYKTRLSTPSGRRILMNAILKGKHVLSH